MSELTAKQLAFVNEYLVDLNGTRAAIRAGYSETSAHSIAHENLRKPEIALAIDKAMAERAGVTRTRVVDELAQIAFSNAGDYFEWGPGGVTLKDSADLTAEQRAVVAEVSESKTKDGGAIRLKLSDKQAALEKLGRILGMFKDRVEHSGPDGGPIQTEEKSIPEAARRIAFLFAQAAAEKSKD